MPKKGTRNPIAEYQVIDNIYFYKETGSGYFLGNVPDSEGKKHPVRAHVYVWEKYNGKVPPMHSVHHIDRNKANNSIENLTLLSYSEHSSLHSKENAKQSSERMNTIARPKAIEWHKSEAGSAMHRKHYEDSTKAIWQERVTMVCEICGKEYETNHASMHKSRFCSNNCKAKFRRMSGVDNETRLCAICGSEFTCNKYSKQKTCGNKECANESQRRIKIGKPRHQKSNL